MDELERLISRHLDGRLTAEEELALQRVILRDPEARRLFEQSVRIDALAGEVLRDDAAGTGLSFDPLALATVRDATKRPRYRRTWWLVPAALAACLAGAILLRPAWGPTTPQPVGPLQLVDTGREPFSAVTTPGTEPGQMPAGDEYGLRQAALTPRRVVRDTTRDWIGVEAEDGSVYWIALDQVRTVRGRPAQADTKLASQRY
ncbi:MAG TPA: hypothetical protein PKK06_01255 [Phycisphaerae bacterium]|nr:hypothetical protein [Phycisphaerae bacterium]HNU43764.1 hypothetical protein [Phycisphaerae bacterium]